jgi:hypothetical protein
MPVVTTAVKVVTYLIISMRPGTGETISDRFRPGWPQLGYRHHDWGTYTVLSGYD